MLAAIFTACFIGGAAQPCAEIHEPVPHCAMVPASVAAWLAAAKSVGWDLSATAVRCGDWRPPPGGSDD